LERKCLGQVAYRLDLTLLDKSVDQKGCLALEVFAQPAHRRRRHDLLQHPARTIVQWRSWLENDALRSPWHLLGEILQADAARRRIGSPIVESGKDLPVPRHRINPIARQIDNGTCVTHARMVAIRLGKEVRCKGIDSK